MLWFLRIFSQRRTSYICVVLAQTKTEPMFGPSTSKGLPRKEDLPLLPAPDDRPDGRSSDHHRVYTEGHRGVAGVFPPDLKLETTTVGLNQTRQKSPSFAPNFAAIIAFIPQPRAQTRGHVCGWRSNTHGFVGGAVARFSWRPD
jgi:hypothetical protein